MIATRSGSRGHRVGLNSPAGRVRVDIFFRVPGFGRPGCGDDALVGPGRDSSHDSDFFKTRKHISESLGGPQATELSLKKTPGND